MAMKMNINRLPYFRMVGYTSTILMHSINSYVMLRNLGENMNDPKIEHFSKFAFKFITCWSFIAQTIHAILGMSCDVMTLTLGDQHKFLNHFKQARDILFAGIVVPYSLTVAAVFWPFFLYDRELVLPYYTVKVVGNLSNHIIHTAIVPATLWELVFQPRQAPSSHKQNIGVMATVAVVYLTIIFYTYFEVGSFPYPIMTMLYGSIYLVLFMALPLASLPFYYFAQWPLTKALWNGQSEKKVC